MPVMSDLEIALIAAGSALAGSIVTGWFTRSAGHRQADAARHAGNRQADALLHTVQATLDEQRRSQAEDRRRQAYVGLLQAAEKIGLLGQRGVEESAALVRASTLVSLEGPGAVAFSGFQLAACANEFPIESPVSEELSQRFITVRQAFEDAARASLNSHS
jgi:hypothetical protein